MKSQISILHFSLFSNVTNPDECQNKDYPACKIMDSLFKRRIKAFLSIYAENLKTNCNQEAVAFLV